MNRHALWFRKTALLVLVAAALAACFIPASANPRYVVAEGVGAIIAGDAARARDEALRDARRRAVELAVGAFIKTETLMQNMEVVQDTVLSQAEGYVTEEQILSEWREDDLYRVRIEAAVDTLSLENDLALLIHRAGNPQVLIVISETNVGQLSPLSLLESQMRRVLVDKGFHVVDAEQSERNRLRQMAKALLTASDFSSAASIALRHQADILILGTAFTQIKTKTQLKGGLSAYSVEACADVRAVNAQTAQVVASMGTRGHAYASSAAVAGSRALTQMAPELVESLIPKILKSEPAARTIHVTVTGVNSYMLERRVQNQLKVLRAVEGVYRRMWENGTAQYDVKTTLSADDIALRLEQISEVPLKIVGINLNEIQVQVAGNL